MKIVIYTRTSTIKQNISEQLKFLINFCDKNNWEITRTFKDFGKSGITPDREGLIEMFNFISENKIDKILVTELSRLSRNKEDLKNIILKASNLNCSIFFVDLNVETLKDGKLNLNHLQVLYDEINYSSRETIKIRSRIERGYNSFRENGGKVGRKKGFRNTDAELLLKHEDVVENLLKGLSIRSTMLICNKSSGVVQKIKKILKNNGSLSEDIKTIRTNDLLKKILNNPSSKTLLDF